MDELSAITIGKEAIRTAMMVAFPMLAAGMLVGILVSILQVATSIQDVTITFIPKILTVFITFVLALHWIIRLLTGFTREIFHLITAIGS